MKHTGRSSKSKGEETSDSGRTEAHTVGEEALSGAHQMSTQGRVVKGEAREVKRSQVTQRQLMTG